MKFIPIIFAVLLFTTSSFFPAPASAKCEIFFKGLYKVDLEDGDAVYFRFFKDGSVLHTTSTQNETHAFSYLQLENKDNLLFGKYSDGNCNIKGKVKGETGVLSFWGSIQGETLLLTMKNHQSGQTIDKSLEYYEIEEK